MALCECPKNTEKLIMRPRYIIVKTCDLLIMSDQVNALIADGYFPIGGLCSVSTDYGINGNVMFYQALILNT
ncbi:hypothetical protein GCM10028808_72930 [Spirosoma migulaei]